MMDSEFFSGLRSATAKTLRQIDFESLKEPPTSTNHFKIMRNAVRSGNRETVQDFVTYLYTLLMKSDSEHRVHVMMLFDYFFNRSHLFREAVVLRMEELLRLVCETDPLHFPLPPTVVDAKMLKAYSVRTVKNWHEKFGVGYPKLRNAGNFLRMSKSVDFERASAEMAVEQQRKEEQIRLANLKTAKVVDMVSEKYGKIRDEITRCMTEVDSALRILVPTFDNDSMDSCDEATVPRSIDVQNSLHGMAPGQTFTIHIDSAIPHVSVTEDNEAIVTTVLDGRVMLNVHRGIVNKWIQKLTQAGAKANILRELVILKSRLDSSIVKIDELRLTMKMQIRERRRGSSEGSGLEKESDSDNDFEDVPDKQLEDFSEPYEVPSYILQRVRSMDTQEPCCSKSLTDNTMQRSNLQPTASDAVDEEKPRVPMVSYGLDLKYWGEEKRTNVQVPRNNSDCHRFWRPSDDGDASVAEEQNSIYETRVYTFVGEDLRSRRQCRARLEGGRLCPRMDANRCPLHGVILPRDEEGFPLKELADDEKKLLSSLDTQRETEEEDQYIRDVEAATGRSLTGGASTSAAAGRLRQKKKIPEAKATRDRLEKKLLDKRAIKRVSEMMDAMRQAKIQKKFGDQYVHSISNR